jgi:hypothetical protein
MIESRGKRTGLPVVPAREEERQPPTVCRKLRTKMAFGALQGTEDWRFGESTTAVYWCLRTMETAGPDDSFAHPHGCQSGRGCFAAPDGADLFALIEEPGDSGKPKPGLG